MIYFLLIKPEGLHKKLRQDKISNLSYNESVYVILYIKLIFLAENSISDHGVNPILHRHNAYLPNNH